MTITSNVSCLDRLNDQVDLDNQQMLNLIYQRKFFIENPNNIHETAIIGDGAILTGDITIGPNTVIFYNSMIQGDKGPISIGVGSCIVDGVLMHNQVKIGNYVHIAHGSIIHRRGITGCLEIGSGSLIGFGCQVHESIGKGCQIAPGLVVSEPIPDYHFVYEKNLGDGLRKTIISPMRAKNYERVLAMYKNFWGRRIIYKGRLIPLTWTDYVDSQADGLITYNNAIEKLKTFFNYK